MDPFMQRAIKLAVKNVKEGGQPFGAVLVKDGEIISEGVNELHLHYDVSGHAEMLAIRRAQKKLQTADLHDYVMYASGEPCPMCLTAMYQVGIKKIYFWASIEDAEKVGLGKSKVIYEELSKNREDRSIEMIYLSEEEIEENPLKMWEKKNRS